MRVLGRVLAADGETDAAHRAFEDSVSLLDHNDDSYELALVRLNCARLLVTSGFTDRAGRLLRDAERGFRRLGAVLELTEVIHMLFDIRRAADPESALVDAVAGLLTAGLEPPALCHEVLAAVCLT